jgi:excisionase family DNA binding protein
MEIMTAPTMLRPNEIAKSFHVSSGLIRKLIASGELGAVKVGRALLVPETELADFLQQRRFQPAQKLSAEAPGRASKGAAPKSSGRSR